MEKNNKLTIKKVQLNHFIETLVDLYDKGVDFIDIIGTIDDRQDSVGISFCKEYMNPEYAKNFDSIPVTKKKPSPTPKKVKTKLSDDDLNQLI